MPGQSDNTTDTLRVIRVFLASPSDLAEERRVARDSIDEINRTVARPAGFHVDLIGWEDTLSSAGRPQSVINEDLEACQMFIGMIWARWGTPPDTDGPYSSGFEEEFERSLSRYSSVGEPHIALFFKDVEQSKLADAGPELSKVLKFKDRIIAEKKVLFDTFFDANAFGQKVRISVSGFIHKLTRAELATRIEDISNENNSQKPSKVSPSPTLVRTSENLDEEAVFLKEISSKYLKEAPSLSVAEIARLRNIAAVLGARENDQSAVGAHDANILYERRIEFTYSVLETMGLGDAGLEGFSDENAPIWIWLANLEKNFPTWICYCTISGTEKRRGNAFRAMKLLRKRFPEDAYFNTASLDQLWFGESVPASVKNSALDYIGELGDPDFLPFAEREFDKNSYATSKSALDAIISLLGKNSVREAAKYALRASFDDLGKSPMALVLAGMEEMDDTPLVAGIEHRAGAIRARAIEILGDRKKLTELQLRRFFGDSAFEARRAAVFAFETSVRPLSHQEAREALVLKPSSNTLGALGTYDFKGHNAVEELKRRRLSRSPLSELQNGMSTEIIGVHDYYFALAEAQFGKARLELRSNVDDRFVTYFKRHLDTIRRKFGPERGEEIANIVNQHEGQTRREFVRRALGILVSKADRDDLSRVRRVLDEDAAVPDSADITYFGRCGQWEDISRVTKIYSYHRSGGNWTTLLSARSDVKEPARAIIKLAKGRIGDLFSADIPPPILAAIIGNMPAASFKRLSQKVIDSLLHSETSPIRKATALRILTVFGAREANAFLARYLDPTKQHYYNVIFWLDLCVAWDRDTYGSVALRELRRSEELL